MTRPFDAAGLLRRALVIAGAAGGVVALAALAEALVRLAALLVG
jgi:hypothetical protein